jgi:hypothetical protein
MHYIKNLNNPAIHTQYEKDMQNNDLRLHKISENFLNHNTTQESTERSLLAVPHVTISTP